MRSNLYDCGVWREFAELRCFGPIIFIFSKTLHRITLILVWVWLCWKKSQIFYFHAFSPNFARLPRQHSSKELSQTFAACVNGSCKHRKLRIFRDSSFCCVTPKSFRNAMSSVMAVVFLQNNVNSWLCWCGTKKIPKFSNLPFSFFTFFASLFQSTQPWLPKISTFARTSMNLPVFR